MALFFHKKKQIEKTTPEALLASGFSEAFGEATKKMAAFQSRARETAEELPGRMATLVFRGSNIPVAAFVSGLPGLDGEQHSSICRLWLAASTLAGDQEITLCNVTLEGPEKDAFLWQVMELKAFCLFSQLPEQTEACLWLSASFWKVLENRAKTTGQEQPEPVLPLSKPGVFLAERLREIPVLEALCAPAFRSGTAVYSTVVKSFGVFNLQSDTSATGFPFNIQAPVWFKASFEYLEGQADSQPKALTFLLALSKASVPKNLPQTDMPRFLSAIAESAGAETIKRFLALSGLQAGRLGIKPMEKPPELPKTGDILFVEFSVRASAVSLSAGILIPVQALFLLSKAWKIHATAERLKSDPAGILFELDSRMLAKKLPAIIASPELRTRVPRFCLNELFRLLSDHDFALVLQNVLLPEYGVKGLPALLFYSVTATGADNQSTEHNVPYGPLDGSRLESFLPEASRADFFLQVKSLNGHPLESCTTANSDALHKILQSVLAARIASSPRLEYILREVVLKEDRIETEKKTDRPENTGHSVWPDERTAADDRSAGLRHYR
jgi:hypothetical protein